MRTRRGYFFFGGRIVVLGVVLVAQSFDCRVRSDLVADAADASRALPDAEGGEPGFFDPTNGWSFGR